LRAGNLAKARNAFKEAVENYQQGIALLDLLPESVERDLRELELRQPTVSMLQMTMGWAAPEALMMAERVASLAEKTGDQVRLGDSLVEHGIAA
jgi:hypothetical protein